MNAEYLGGDIFTRLLPPAQPVPELCAVPSVKKRRPFRRAVCAVLSAISLTSYGAAVYAGAEKIVSADILEFCTGDVFVFAKEEETPAAPVAEPTVIVVEPPKEAVTEAPVKEKVTFPICGVDLSCSDPTVLANQTGYEPDTEALSAIPAFADTGGIGGDEPLVLIVHTHGTEAYTPEGADTYTDETSFRSSDVSENVVAVGDAIAKALEDAGVGVIHCREMFDEQSYVESYARSAEAVARIVSENPSVRYVLDVHRDAIFRGDTLVAPRAAGAAQVMLVCGTDEMGAVFPDWEDNLSFALAVQSAATEKWPGMMRSINLRGASFNEQLAERFLLVEVGSAGNTLSEACEAGRRFAGVFAGVIR